MASNPSTGRLFYFFSDTLIHFLENFLTKKWFFIFFKIFWWTGFFSFKRSPINKTVPFQHVLENFGMFKAKNFPIFLIETFIYEEMTFSLDFRILFFVCFCFFQALRHNNFVSKYFCWSSRVIPIVRRKKAISTKILRLSISLFAHNQSLATF